jgi:signal transduction histidine kinase
MRCPESCYPDCRTKLLLRSVSFIRRFLVDATRSLAVPCCGLLIPCCILLFSCSNARAQSPISPQKHLAGLLLRYREHTLGDTPYLKAVDSTISLVLSDDSLQQLLSTYQKIAFDNPGLGRYRMMYYRSLAVNSINKNKYGSAIYYAGKANEEAVKIGRFEKGGISHSDLFSISIYFINRDYARVVAEYDTLRPAILKLPAAIQSGKVSPEQAYVALNIMQIAVGTLYKTRDTALANEGIGVCEKMMEEIDKQPGKFKSDMTLYNWIYHSMCFEKEKYLDHFDRAGDFLQTALREVRSKDFPSNLQGSCLCDEYTDAFDFYFDHGRKDSAQRYLSLVHDMSDSILPYSFVKQSFLLESNSEILASNGHFDSAYKELLKVYRLKDSSFYAVSSDRDNNLYALAQEENTRNELIRSEAKKRKAERSNTILFLLLVFMVFGGGAWFFLYRSKQKQRLLNLQLNLARNFHDDIGPMLLYASILAKKEAEGNPSAGLEELKVQLMYIMEAVRGISHDLKSSKLSTVSSFYEDTILLLEKIKSSTQIDFKARIHNGSRVLSQLQYANLWKIVNELITNSVKHARCSLITLYVKATERDLRIEYADNGQGMALDLSANGIGIQNMQERVNLLNGEFQLHNAYPKGYSIAISIPLL